MEDRSIAIIGGIALFFALLTPFVIENQAKIDKHYTAAGTLYNRGDFTGAIMEYTKALKESRKLFTKTDHIDKDFRTHINIKIARCYYDIGNSTQDQNNYKKALKLIDENLAGTKDSKHYGELQHLKALINYKKGIFDVSLSNLLKNEKTHGHFEWYHEIIYTIGDIYYKQEGYKKALEYFKKLIKLHPNSQYCNQAIELIEKIKKKIEPEPKPEPSPISIPEWEKEAKQKLDNANALKQQKKFTEATEQYTELIRQYEKSQFVSYAYEGIGDIYSLENNYIDARANYEEAIYSTNDEIRKSILYDKYHRTFLKPTPVPIDPDPIPEILVEAIRLRESGKYIEAAEQFMKLVDMEKTYEEKSYALTEASFCYYKAHQENKTNFGISVNALRELIKKYSESEYTMYAYYYLTKIYYGRAFLVKTDKTYFQSVIDTVEDAEDKFYSSGEKLTQDLLRRMMRLKKGAKEKIDGPEPKPNGPEPKPNGPEPIRVKPETKLVDQGYSHLENKALEKALEKAKEALKINPKYRRAEQLITNIKNQYFKKGLDHLENHNYEHAILEFSKAIKIDPEMTKGYCNLGVVYIYMEKYNDALIVLKKAIIIDSQFKEAYFNLGLVYFELKKYLEAEKVVKKALEINQEYENAKILMNSIQEKIEQHN